MPAGLEPKSGSVSPKQPISSPAAIRGSQACFCSSLPQRQIANMASDPCTETRLRTPESPASSSRQARPYETAFVPAQPYPSRCMPSRPSEPASLTMPRSMSPRSYQSATYGFTRWSTNSRTVRLDVALVGGQQVVDLQQVQGAGAGHLRSIPATCWAAFSMSSSPSSTCWAAVPNGTKLSRLDDPADRPGEARARPAR